jgi:hypothetical protein
MRDNIETRIEKMSSDHANIDLDLVSMLYVSSVYSSFKRYHQAAGNDADARYSISQISIHIFGSIRRLINMKNKSIPSMPFSFSNISFVSRNLDRCSYAEDDVLDDYYYHVLELEED